MTSTYQARAWKHLCVAAVMRRDAADGGAALKVEIDVQTRTAKAGTVYRWKERYDFGAGDSSEEFPDLDECKADARRHADENSNT